jgi:hypothetical protein
MAAKWTMESRADPLGYTELFGKKNAFASACRRIAESSRAISSSLAAQNRPDLRDGV